MTIGEVRISETEEIIAPVNLSQNSSQTKLIDENSSNIKFEGQKIKTEIKNRFARLKKSLRKRSVSIL